MLLTQALVADPNRGEIRDTNQSMIDVKDSGKLFEETGVDSVDKGKVIDSTR